MYQEAVWGEPEQPGVTLSTDDNCLAVIKHYRSLMPMGQEARKPVFMLKPADGAIGAHLQSVRADYKDFETLAHRIAREVGAGT